MKSYYDEEMFFINDHKIYISVYDKINNFSKFRHLFLEEFEDNFDVKYIDEEFNEFGGFYNVSYKYLTVNIEICFYPNSNCNLIQEEVIEKRYKMKCN